jgi:hypothetical protein
MSNKEAIHKRFVKWVGRGDMKAGMKILKTRENVFDMYHDFIVNQIQDIMLEYLKIIKRIEKYGLTLNTTTNFKVNEIEVIIARPIWNYSNLGSGNSFFAAVQKSIKRELQDLNNGQIFKEASVSEKTEVVASLTTLSIRLQELIGDE